MQQLSLADKAEKQDMPVVAGKHPPWRHAIWSVADNFSQQALSFAIFVLLSRWLTPTAFGLLAIAHLLVQFMRMAVLDALVLPTLRQPQFGSQDFKWLFTICSVTGLVGAALIVAVAYPLGAYFEAPDLVPVFMGMSIAVIFHGLNRAYDAVLLRQADFRLLAIRSMISVTFGGIAAIVLASRGLGAMALVTQQIVLAAVTFLISATSEWKHWRPGWVFSAERARRHAREAAGVSASSLLVYANSNADAAVVSAVFGPAAAGIYNLAKRVTSAVFLMIAAALNRVASSLFLRSADDSVALRAHYSRVAADTLLGLALIFGVIGNFSSQIVPLVFGPQWAPAVPVMTALCVAGLCQGFFNIGQNLSLVTGRSHRPVRLGTAQLVVALLLAAVLMQKFSGFGVALGFGAAAALMSVIMHYRVSLQLHIGSKEALVDLAPAAIGLAALTGASRYMLGLFGEAMGWLQLLLAMTAVTMAYLVAATSARIILAPPRKSFGTS